MSLLAFESISKAFPGVQALDRVSFSVEAGSIHALCGENGAGKSTILKILSGVYQPDEGQIHLDGSPVEFANPKDAIDQGIAVIYQELNLVKEITVAENIWLGHLPNHLGIVARPELNRLAKASLDRVGLDVKPETKLGELSLAQQQMVEIAKALTHKASVIAFDEPTSSLSDREVKVLFDLIRQLQKEGKAILYVSHRMDEVTSLCDACTVLRDGKHIETFNAKEEIKEQTIVNRMVGRAIEDIYNYSPRKTSAGGLVCHQVTGKGLAQPADLEVAKGEIVGIYGLVGAGRTELLKAIYQGQGDVTIDGISISRGGATDSIQSGLVLCPEDRKHEGIFPVLGVGENINTSIRRKWLKAGLVIDRGKESGNAAEFIEKLRIKTPKSATEIRTLSGGNQQKAILARWLSESVRVLLLDEPTRGIDVGAKSEIYAIMRQAAESGVAVLFVSSDLPEILGVSDRVLVMAMGQIRGSIDRTDATEERLLQIALTTDKVGA